MARTYELVGGPLDGQHVALEEGKSTYEVFFAPPRPRFWRDDDVDPSEPVKPRRGWYAVREHPTHGEALVWQGETP